VTAWWLGLETSWFWGAPVALDADLVLGPDSTVEVGPGDRVFVDGRECLPNGHRIFCAGPVGGYACRLPCPKLCPLCARGQAKVGSLVLYRDEFSGELDDGAGLVRFLPQGPRKQCPVCQLFLTDDTRDGTNLCWCSPEDGE
jgi:hypothetical protein